MPEVILALLAKAKQLPAAGANFRTKHLDVWVNADSAWMDMSRWDACAEPGLSLDDAEGEGVFLGLDIATRNDVCSKAYVWQRASDGKVCLVVKHWLPSVALDRDGNSQYQGWHDEGRLEVTPGEVLDLRVFEDEIREDARRFELKAVGFDPYNFTSNAAQLTEDGIPMIEVPMRVAKLSEPMKKLAELVLGGKLVHNGCPVLAWMVSNVVAHVDANDNIFTRKERPENKIDGVVATIVALGRFMSEDQSAVAEQGFVAL